jgi:hypothetical protein
VERGSIHPLPLAQPRTTPDWVSFSSISSRQRGVSTGGAIARSSGSKSTRRRVAGRGNPPPGRRASLRCRCGAVSRTAGVVRSAVTLNAANRASSRSDDVEDVQLPATLVSSRRRSIVCTVCLAASAGASVDVACDRIRSGCLGNDAIRAWIEDGNLTVSMPSSVRAPNASPTFEAGDAIQSCISGGLASNQQPHAHSAYRRARRMASRMRMAEPSFKR